MPADRDQGPASKGEKYRRIRLAEGSHGPEAWRMPSF